MNDSGNTIIGFLIIVGFIYLVYYSIKKEDQNAREFTLRIQKSIVWKAKKIIKKHSKQLAVERKKYVYNDAYGNENVTRWIQKEIPYFVENYLFPVLTDEEIVNFHLASNMVIENIETATLNEKLEKVSFNKNMSGFEFEEFCLELLTESGWNVSKTKNGADQGVDLLAKKGKRNIAIQCKKYSRPVSNKAVQEIKTGLEYYALGEGIVISNADFTKSAKQLATANNIKLVHYLEIEKI